MAEVSFAVRLVPRASRSELAGIAEGVLRVRVTAPPVDGKANVALRRLIAKEAGVPLRDVEIVRGASSREKVLRVECADPSAVRRALGLA